jgi:hypothetical protein
MPSQGAFDTPVLGVLPAPHEMSGKFPVSLWTAAEDADCFGLWFYIGFA